MSIKDRFSATVSSAAKYLFKSSELQNKRDLLTSESFDKLHLDIEPVLEGLVVAQDNLYKENNNVYNDVEFFERFTNSNDVGMTRTKCVFDVINKCSLQGSGKVLKKICHKPVADVDVLNKRKEALKSMEKVLADPSNEQTVVKLLDVMHKTEKDVAWLFTENKDTINELYDIVFFRLKGLRPLNNNGTALTVYNIYRIFISPVFGIIAPLIYFVIPYIIVLYKFKVKIPFKMYLRTIFHTIFNSEDTILGSGKGFKYVRIISYLFSAVFYFQGIFNSIDLAKTVNKISSVLVNNLHGAVQFLQASHELNKLLWEEGSMNAFVKFASMTSIGDDENVIVKLKSSAYSVFSKFGEHLKTYKYMNLPSAKYIVQKAYVVDSLLSVLRFKKENAFTFSEFLPNGMENATPTVHLKDMVHPCIPSQFAVKNDVFLGNSDTVTSKQNAIITSPNSSGKSVLIKSIMINILMAQTICISCSSSSQITPFTYITTHVNVPDSTGYESLFEAEMHRCKRNLDVLHELSVEKRPKLSLIVMDEIFNSTNPVEAVAGAYAVCKRIASYHSNLLIFTTHFNYLTKLAKEPSCMFDNYRMQTEVGNGDVKFSYKLEKGVNKHLLALELLKKSGFDNDIVDEAIRIKNALTAKKSR
jgi:DNA mismatch repair ATPase MutS